ncbi:MAG: heparinase II/III family protein [Nitratireductor sp.]|nr:heparinase II/III family protein [Nitratireductor sp.]
MKTIGQAGAEAMRRLARRMRKRPYARLFAGNTPERLLLAPQDVRNCDPATAMDIYSGRYFLAGRMVDLDGRDPFREKGVPLQWQRELHAFQWLRHLDAASTGMATNNAKALIRDWMASHGKPSGSIAWNEEIAAKRLISWICHSVPVIESADPVFYRNWLKSIGLHIRFLKLSANDAANGMPRLTARIALAYAQICVDRQDIYLRRAGKNLCDELNRQILPDGSHITRNPANILNILALLLPLREAYARFGHAPGQEMVSAIDRMMVAMKFYRLGDGSFARFNGVGPMQSDLVSTLLRYDDSLGTPPQSATDSGYQRMMLGDTIIIADTGKPPTGVLSERASAGTLSFEFSSGTCPVMVNCGMPAKEDSELLRTARATAAHNTATINNTSSSRFYSGTRFVRFLRDRIVSGPSRVICRRSGQDDSSTQFDASHDGYLKPFGVIHSRMLRLEADGNVIKGIDRFTAKGGKPVAKKRPVQFAIRFHLHPSVSAGKGSNPNTIILMCGKGITWRLVCIDAIPQIEDSIFIASVNGPRRTKQIVIEGDSRDTPEVRWIIQRDTTTSAAQGRM